MDGVMGVYLKHPDFMGDENTKLEGDGVWGTECVLLGDREMSRYLLFEIRR